MKKIRIKFSGMGGHFDENDNFIINILKKKYEVILTDAPDYLFYSVNSKDYLKYKCIRIFYTAENCIPDFNICDYAIGFHYIEFQDRYIRFPLYLVESFAPYKGDNYGEDLKRTLKKHENVTETLALKKEFCSFVVSNGNAAACRRKFFYELNKYKKVNSGGHYMNNVGAPVTNKLKFQLRHKFAIAFENSSSPGYTTEKIIHAYSAGTVPIYWGDPYITKIFNAKSFINCHEFGLTDIGENSAIDEIIKYIKKIDEDNKLYRDMLLEPAFNNPDDIDIQKIKFENFLYHIMDQDYNDAYRRDRILWGIRYERKQRIGNMFYYFFRRLIPIRDFVRNIVDGSIFKSEK